MSTPFDRLLGASQGRIRPAGATPVDGSFVFCLGSDVPGVVYPFSIGDNVLLSQTADITGLKAIYFSVIVRPPSSLPVGARWFFQWGVDATVCGQRELKPGRTLTLSDGVIDVSQLNGNHDIRFRLKVTS